MLPSLLTTALLASVCCWHSGAHARTLGSENMYRRGVHPLSSRSAIGTAPGRRDTAAKKEVAAYFGQGRTFNGDTTLVDYCKNEFLDTIILSFVNTYFSDKDGLPGSNHAGYCPNPPNGTDLTMCPDWEQTIKDCQQIHGKKVLMSIGGVSDATLPSADKAATLADNLWKLYGEGSGLESKRPFGSAIVDGFDLDIENQKPDHYIDFINQMRQNIKDEGSKNRTYVLTGAPSCPNPDNSLQDAVNYLDILYIMFYNTPNCEYDNMYDAAKIWSDQLSSKGVDSARFFVSVPGDNSTNSARNGYVDADALKGYASKLSGLSNFAGFSTWCAETAANNTMEAGKTYLEVMKEALQ